MKRYLIFAGLTMLLFSCGSNNKKADLYPQKIEIKIVNPLDIQRNDQPVGIKLAKFKKKYQDFNENNCIVMLNNSEIPHQVVDHNGDGKADGLLFLLNMKPKEEIKVLLKYNKIGKSTHNYPKRTQAEISRKFGGTWKDHKYINGGPFKNVDFTRVPDENSDHSFLYRYEGPGWESDKVGYRFYLDWRNAIDIYGKKTGDMVLQNVGQDGYESYHNMNNWGMDILKVGNSLGMGSIGMWYNGKVQMVSNVDSTTCKIAINGPLCSAIVTKYYGWAAGDGKYNLKSRLSIKAGSRLTRHDLKINPQSDNLCTGLVKDKNASPVLPAKNDDSGDWTWMAQYGKQSLNNDNLGMAVLYKKSDLIKLTEDKLSRIVILNPKDGQLTYYFLAAWELEPGGITNEKDFKVYLQQLTQKMNNPVQIIF